ncbi:hypothetical protein LINGRAHAP2_LOCUS29749 [Linum grandiflorum]
MRNRISFLSVGVLFAGVTFAVAALWSPPQVTAARLQLEGRALTGANDQSVSRNTKSQSGNSGSATKLVPPPPPAVRYSHRQVSRSHASEKTNDPNGESKVSSPGNSSPPAVPTAGGGSGQADTAPAPAGFNYTYNEFHPYPNGVPPPGSNETSANNPTSR